MYGEQSMKTQKFINAPNCNYKILNPEWLKINYPKTYELILNEIFNKLNQELDYKSIRKNK
jgi:hypothetical protein